MKVREVLFSQVKGSLAALSMQIDAFDQAETTKEEMYEKLTVLVGEIVRQSFEFGLQVGVSAIQEDIDPNMDILDVDLAEMGDEPDAL